MPNRVNRLLLAESLQRLAEERNIVLVGYRGLTATDAAAFRQDLTERGIVLHVVHNRITIRALEELGRPDLTDLFDGPTAIMDGGEDPVRVAKAAVEFAKRHKALEIRGGLLEGKRCTATEVVAWSRMPSREEQLAIVAGQIVGAGGGLVAAVLGPGAKLAGQIRKLGDEDETKSGEEAA